MVPLSFVEDMRFEAQGIAQARGDTIKISVDL